MPRNLGWEDCRLTTAGSCRAGASLTCSLTFPSQEGSPDCRGKTRPREDWADGTVQAWEMISWFLNRSQYPDLLWVVVCSVSPLTSMSQTHYIFSFFFFFICPVIIRWGFFLSFFVLSLEMHFDHIFKCCFSISNIRNLLLFWGKVVCSPKWRINEKLHCYSSRYKSWRTVNTGLRRQL